MCVFALSCSQNVLYASSHYHYPLTVRENLSCIKNLIIKFQYDGRVGNSDTFTVTKPSWWSEHPTGEIQHLVTLLVKYFTMVQQGGNQLCQ